MKRMPPTPEARVDEAEPKVSATLVELQEATHTQVKDIDLDDVVETDAAPGHPACTRGCKSPYSPTPGAGGSHGAHLCIGWAAALSDRRTVSRTAPGALQWF